MGFDGRIAIGLPHVGDLSGFFFDSYSALSMPPDTILIRVENKAVDLARNMIVDTVLKGDGGKPFTHLFFMDSDMRFPSEALLRLVAADKDIIGGTYFSRDVPPIPHVYRFHHEDNDDGTCPLAFEEGDRIREPLHKDGHRGRWYKPEQAKFAAYLKAHPEFRDLNPPTVFPHTDDALIQADTLGTGCMLIKREVLEAMQYPWFKCHERSAGGEDFYFCEQAKRLGFEVWANWAVQCQHEFRHVFMDYQDWYDVFKVGTPEEQDWNHQIIVDASPKSMDEPTQKERTPLLLSKYDRTESAAS